MHVFDGLTALDVDGNLMPALAASWEATSDTTWVFNLREDVTFHSGEAFDASVVIANLERMRDPNEPRANYSFDVIQGWRATGPYQIEVTTVAPDPLLAARMKSFFMAPPSMLDNPKSDDFNRHPVGTGAFRFVEWVPDERIVLEANPDYFRGPPQFDRLIFRAIPEGSSRVSELLTGGVDVVAGLQPEFIDLVESGASTHVSTRVSPINDFIILRTDVESPLQDVRVRQALNYAVDIDTIIETILSGYATRHATLVHPFVLGYNPDVKPYEYDPEKARQLLTEAGYPDGFSIDFDLTPSIGGINNVEVAQAIVEQLAQVGVDVNLQVLEYGVARTRVYGDRSASPMIRWQWKTWDNDPDGIFYGLLHSTGLGSFNNDPAIDELVMAGRFNLDQEERAQIYSKIQEIIKEEATHIFLYYSDAIYGVSDRVEWVPRIDERLFFYEAVLKE
jgi:peptide/nickel transport system substrate-binding protein